MKNLRSITTRSLIALSVMGMGLVLTAKPVSAAPIVFTVHEDPALIPGVVDNTFDADNITGKYAETLTLNPGAGTFSANLLVEFASYADGGTLQTSQLENFGPSGYGLYALVTVSGNYTSSPDPVNPGTQTLYSFDPTASTAQVYLDPDQTIGGDTLILSASAIDPVLSVGLVRVLNSTGQVLEGSYALVYTNGQTTAAGDIYWPDFAGFTLRATASGDVDPSSNIVTGVITGDTSLDFERSAPEPATLALFGMALFGSGLVARRRRKV